MKASQLIILLIFSQIMLQAVYYSTQHQDIDVFVNEYNDVLNTSVVNMNLEVNKAQDKGIWSNPLIQDVSAAFQNTVNLVFAGLMLIGLVIGNLFTVNTFLFTQENSVILKSVGLISVVIIGWFNIHIIITLWKSLRGTNT